ncbi:unnamed protein product [Caenorhabditis brenneri]
MDFGHFLERITEEKTEDPGELADESSSSDDESGIVMKADEVKKQLEEDVEKLVELIALDANTNITIEDKLPQVTQITVKMSMSVPEKGGIFDALRVESNDPNDSLREESSVTPKIDEKNLEYIGEVLERKKSVVPFLTQTINQLALVRNEKMERAADLICTLFRLPHGSTDCSFFRLIKVLRSFGIWENDPRLKQMFDRMKKHDEENEDSRQWAMSQEKFKEIIFPCTILISRTLRNQLIIPSWLEFTQMIETIFDSCRDSKEGEVASYIPQLARQSPHTWGMSICTIDGQRFSLGDSKKNFCLQSVSKAFNYAIVASEIGSHVLHQYVGHEPSGRLFNEICLDSNNMPHNPLINAGAIVVTSMIKPTHSMADRFDFMLNKYRKLAGGGHVGFDNATFLSERDTADRNYALSYYMKEYRCFPDESQVYEKGLREELDLYFQLCSLETNCDTAAVMAATLANGGICPLSTEKCLGSRPCRDILSLMYSCGMYDYSGKFAFQVGLPAKSGVSGIMIVVIPNVMGIALYSPPLDKTGNSCRGVAFCRQLIDKFNFHNYDSLLHPDDSRKIDPRRKIGPRENETIVQVMYAAKNGDLDSLRRMFMQGADLKTADYDNRTALHVAAAEGRIKVCKFLINIVGIPHNARDRWGRYPLDDARQFKNKEVALYLFRLQYPTKKMPENWFEVGGDLLVSELENCADNSSVDDNVESSGEDEGITGMLTDDLEKREWALHANGNMGEINYQLVRRKSSKAPPTPEYKPPSFGYGSGQKHHEKHEKVQHEKPHHTFHNINGHGHMNGNGTHQNGHHHHHIPHHMMLNGAAGGMNSRRLSSPNEQDEDNRD